MGKSINVTSFAALEELALSLKKFATKSQDALQSARLEVRRQSEILEERYQEQKRQVRWFQAQYDNTDEDEVDQWRNELEEAIEKLTEIRRWRNRVEEQQTKFDRQIRKFSHLADEQTIKACSFIMSRVQELQEYLALTIEPHAVNTSPVVINEAYVLVDQDVIQSDTTLTDYLLPDGFKWFNIEEISPRDLGELPIEADFKKISYEEMQRGFETLQQNILPVLNENPLGVEDTYFRELDMQISQELPAENQRVYEAFFGKDSIQVEWNQHNNHYEIMNGRHRIKVARDKGWKYVPVRFI